jgi:two-component system chemotaxis response regulator CheY
VTAMRDATHHQPIYHNIPILVVDDYLAMVTTTRRMLQTLGFDNVTAASDGVDALAALRSMPYQLVISDLRMEKMDGLALLLEVRADPALRDIPFIMVTASGEIDYVAAAKRAGVTDYIVKPFSVATLKAKLTAVLSRLIEQKRIARPLP